MMNEPTPSLHSFTHPAIWRRFAAIIYDSLLLMAISMGYGALILGIGKLIFNDPNALTTGMIFQVGWLICLLSFFCFFWIKAGQTLGMRAWRLKVVQELNDHRHPTLTQCLLRCLFAPLGLSFFIIAYIRKDKQCLHDLISNTQLILTPKGH